MSSSVENLVTSCPQCNSLVGLPSIMSLDAPVRCPVCRHKYTLRSRLPQQIPQLELVMEEEEAETETEMANEDVAIDPMAKLEVNEILRKNAKLSRHRSRRHGEHSHQHRGKQPEPVKPIVGAAEQPSGFAEFQEASVTNRSAEQSGWSSSPNASKTAIAEPQTAGELVAFERRVARRASQRQRTVGKSKTKEWVEIAKVILGALLALPVAQLIIWWVLAVDPLQLAPSVAKVVPFAVPGKVLKSEPE